MPFGTLWTSGKKVHKPFKKRKKSVQNCSEAFWSEKKRSRVLEWKQQFRSSFSLEFGKIDRFWLWCWIFHDQEDPGIKESAFCPLKAAWQSFSRSDRCVGAKENAARTATKESWPASSASSEEKKLRKNLGAKSPQSVSPWRCFWTKIQTSNSNKLYEHQTCGFQYEINHCSTPRFHRWSYLGKGVAIITHRSRISTFYWNQEKRIVQRLEED